MSDDPRSEARPFRPREATERQILGYAALGHDNKVIAYDLGIAHATVRVLMSRAASKLHARSRAEVVAIYRNICQDAPNA